MKKHKNPHIKHKYDIKNKVMVKKEMLAGLNISKKNIKKINKNNKTIMKLLEEIENRRVRKKGLQDHVISLHRKLADEKVLMNKIKNANKEVSKDININMIKQGKIHAIQLERHNKKIISNTKKEMDKTIKDINIAAVKVIDANEENKIKNDLARRIIEKNNLINQQLLLEAQKEYNQTAQISRIPLRNLSDKHKSFLPKRSKKTLAEIDGINKKLQAAKRQQLREHFAAASLKENISDKEFDSQRNWANILSK